MAERSLLFSFSLELLTVFLEDALVGGLAVCGKVADVVDSRMASLDGQEAER